jgi:hypothetical protein
MTSIILAAPRRGRRTIRRSAVTVLATITLAGAIACGGDSGTGPSTTKDPAGSYSLVQIDLKAVPAEIFNGPYFDPRVNYSYPQVLRVTDGEVRLQQDGGFHLAVNRTWSSEGRTGNGVLTVDGTYRIEGSKIFVDTDGGKGEGEFQNGEITLALDVGETGTMRDYTFRRTQ